MLPGVSGVAWLPIPPGKENCLKKRCIPASVFTLVGVNLGIRSLKIGLGQDSRRAMAGPGDVNCIQVVLVDQPVEVNIRKGLAGVRAPVAQQSGLGVLQLQRFSEQWVVLEVQHAQAQVEAGPPVGVDLVQLVGTERGRP